MAHNLKFLLVLILVNFSGSDDPKSNILRLSRPKSTTLRSTSDFKVDDNSDNEKTEVLRDRLLAFSKNNPESDWKTYLKIVNDKNETDGVSDLDLEFSKDKFELNANSIQWLNDIYDPLRWHRIPGKLTPQCLRDMELFINSLRDGKLWAAKMLDASGRYNSQFHFGNGFWLGSSSLCKELNTTDEDGISPINPIISNDELPPYLIKFHVVRMGLSFPRNIEPSTRQIFLGLCLPATCDRISLGSMLRTSVERVERLGNGTHGPHGPKITIVTVKPVPSSDYSVWNDSKLYILGGVGGVIALLMLIATVYDYRRLTEDPDIESTAPGRFWMKCLLSFSPIENGSKILSTDPAARDNLTCLHGLRVLSLGWVILVHTYLQVFSIAENKTLRTVTERNFMFQTISNATFSVDTFFFISGLLVTILFYRSMGAIKSDSNNFLRSSSTKFFIMVLYRFVRLTPAYLFVLGINELAIKQAQATTVFSPVIIDQVTCEKFWWRNALYLNSLFPRSEMCMLWSWYMANDTQFYVLGILLLILSVKYFKAVSVAVVLLIVSSWFTTFTVAYSNDYIARIQEPFALFDELYDKPWLRAGPYFIGTITGWMLFKTNCKIHTPGWAKIIGWIISSGIMLAVVYGLYPGNMTVTVSSLYAALGHTAWALAVSFIVVQCCTGSAAIVNSFLSLRLIYPMSRLTYCAYLVHPVIMMITSMQMDGPLHIHNGLVLTVYFGNLVASYLMSFCISLALEAPVVNLLKIAFASNKRSLNR
ncbi:Similar to nrf-6: Nose resistant to fluoxetine protein 6 (Caenorhabditis elegans) [Cotesia congregata]|uniref:Similar to nrf-6: Nose resistant to fluoxetine protein 6 (Caenorhabditis elegans) n=1 Tax=Cotesia congregata TaxID=51543 RepID=A0A8J2H6H5_COTCN|nr:Similar to nrf-6: Nose resistant to fluoxetine protein 6 (Caenorhabditis elegans) [Cotesia congregata]